MQRKIIRLGAATLVTSLPSKWVVAHGLKPGNELTVEEQGPDLLLRAKQYVRDRSCTVIIPSPKEYMGRLIHTPYRFGYNRMEIQFSDPAVIPLIRRHLDELLGFEIVDQTVKSLTIEMVARGLEEEFDKMLRRAMHVIVTMVKDLTNVCNNHEIDLLSDVIERGKMTNKLTHFLMRVTNTHLADPTEISKNTILITTIEQIGDDITQLAHLIMKKRDPSIAQYLHAFLLTFERFTEFNAKPTQSDLLILRNLVRKNVHSIPSRGSTQPIVTSLQRLDHLLLFYPVGMELKVR